MGLGVWLESIVKRMREGSDVTLRCLPVTSVRNLGSKRSSQPPHQRIHRFAFIVVQVAQTETRPTLGNCLWADTHRSVDFSIVDVAHVVVHVGGLGGRCCSFWSLRPDRRSHCCVVWRRQQGA